MASTTNLSSFSCSGFLDKRSTPHFFASIWRRKWCEIQGSCLVYYSQKPDYEFHGIPDGSVHIRNLEIVKQDENKNDFILRTDQGIEHHFRASRMGKDTIHEQQLLGSTTLAWVDTLREMIRISNEGSSSSIIKTDTTTPIHLSTSSSLSISNEPNDFSIEECYEENGRIPPKRQSDVINHVDNIPPMFILCLKLMGLEPIDTERTTSLCFFNYHKQQFNNGVIFQKFLQFCVIGFFITIIIHSFIHTEFLNCGAWTCSLPWVSELNGYCIGLGLYLWMLRNINESTLMPTHRHRLDEWMDLFLKRIIIYWLVLSILAMIIAQLPDCKNNITEDSKRGPGNRSVAGRVFAEVVPSIVILMSPTFYFFVALYISEALRLICLVEDFEDLLHTVASTKSNWCDTLDSYHRLRGDFVKVQNLMGVAVSAYAISSLLWVAGKAVQTYTAQSVAEKCLYTVHLLGSIPPFLAVLYAMQLVNTAGSRIIKSVSMASAKCTNNNEDLHEVKLMIVIVNLPCQLTSLGRPISSEDMFGYITSVVALQLFAFAQGYYGKAMSQRS